MKARSYACPNFFETRLSRRSLIKVGGMGMLGLTLPKILRGETAVGGVKNPVAKAKSVIFLYQFGGPSHVDMFDRKPDAPEGIRGPLDAIPSSGAGLHRCKGLERLAKVMDKVTLVRSMTHTMKNHNSASYYALTGHEPPSDDIRLKDTLDLSPAYRSVVGRLAPSGGEMPTFVSYPYNIRDGSVTPGQRASFLGKAHDPFFVGADPNGPDFSLPELSLPADLPAGRLEERRELQKL